MDERVRYRKRKRKCGERARFESVCQEDDDVCVRSPQHDPVACLPQHANAILVAVPGGTPYSMAFRVMRCGDVIVHWGECSGCRGRDGDYDRGMHRRFIFSLDQVKDYFRRSCRSNLSIEDFPTYVWVHHGEHHFP